MIIENKNIEIETNIEEEKDFQLNLTRETFIIISKKLYSNKIQSIIRELSSNAYDSHVDNNNINTPFYVHIPTILEPKFILRDYGTGIIPKNINEIYTVYFKSDKTKDNKKIGAYGLGSKSPFAYTDEFEINNYYNGIKYKYFASFYGNTPKIYLLAQEKTTEKNGIQVSFEVKKEDINIFQKEAISIFSIFKVKPNINLDIKDIKYFSFNNDNIRILENDEYLKTPFEKNGIYALQSNILHYIELKEEFFINKGEYENILNFIKYNSIIIKFKIGELEFIPSREKISYDEKSIFNIKKKLKNITFNYIFENIFKNILSNKNEIKKMKNFFYFYNNFLIFYNNIFLKTINNKEMFLLKEKLFNTLFLNNNYIIESINNNKRKKQTYDKINYFTIFNIKKFIYLDKKKNIKNAINKLFYENIKEILFFKDLNFINEIKEKFNINIEYTNISNYIEKEDIIQNEKKVINNDFKYFYYKKYINFKYNINIFKENIEINNKIIFYIPVYKNSYILSFNKKHIQLEKEIMNSFFNIENLKLRKKIYILNNKEYNLLKENYKLINILEVLKKLKDKKISKLNFIYYNKNYSSESLKNFITFLYNTYNLKIYKDFLDFINNYYYNNDIKNSILYLDFLNFYNLNNKNIKKIDYIYFKKEFDKISPILSEIIFNKNNYDDLKNENIKNEIKKFLDFKKENL